MSNKCFVFIICLLFVILSSTGFCQDSTSSTTTQPITSTDPPKTAAQNIKSLVIAITAVEKVKQSFPNVESVEISQLNEQLFVALNQSARFGKVYSTVYDALVKGDYKLNISITMLHRVSETTRFWVGPMAGRAIVVADIELSDTVTGKVFDSKKIEGLSAIGFSYNNSTTGSAVNAAAQKIIALVINDMNSIDK